MMQTTRHSEPVEPRLEGETPACPSGTRVLSLGIALLWAFGLIVVCGIGVFALVTLWAQSLF
jgi:hypothetical protein